MSMEIGVGDKVKVTRAHRGDYVTFIGFVIEQTSSERWTVREQNEGPTHKDIGTWNIIVLQQAADRLRACTKDPCNVCDNQQ